MKTIVIGHRNPDMDAIVSAIGYARLKERIGQEGVVAARAGNTNSRIDFILKKFHQPAPVFVSDVSPQVADVMESEVIAMPEKATVQKAIQVIAERQLRGLPVVDSEGRCLGLLSAYKLHRHLFPLETTAGEARKVTASLDDIRGAFGGELLAGSLEGGVREYLLMVGAVSSRTFAERLTHYPADRLVVFTGDRTQIQRLALQHRVSAIVITGGLPVAEEILDEAREAGVAVIRSHHDSASTVLMSRGAVRVTEMLEAAAEVFTPETALESARRRAAESPAFLFPVLDKEQRLAGILSKSDFLKPVDRQLILMDHNELGQAVAGADKVPIVEVLDHHRLGGLSSNQPILFWNTPLGSTSTIVALAYRQAGVAPEPEIAGLLMAGLISDTLNLTSPTATPTDREVMRELESQTGIKADDLAKEIFSVGSPLQELSAEEAITADCKEYEEFGVRITLAQIEELGFGEFYKRKEHLLEALEGYRQKRDAFFSGCFVTDINTQNSLLLAVGDSEMLTLIDYPDQGSNLWQLQGVVSRKKQLLPHLLELLARVRGAG